jgi:hypothetical protein
MVALEELLLALDLRLVAVALVDLEVLVEQVVLII